MNGESIDWLADEGAEVLGLVAAIEKPIVRLYDEAEERVFWNAHSDKSNMADLIVRHGRKEGRR